MRLTKDDKTVLQRLPEEFKAIYLELILKLHNESRHLSERDLVNRSQEVIEHYNNKNSKRKNKSTCYSCDDYLQSNNSNIEDAIIEAIDAQKDRTTV